jgi:hypothetical protein
LRDVQGELPDKVMSEPVEPVARARLVFAKKSPRAAIT